MFRHSRAKRTTGQALVEFALAATLIFMLLSAAVDLGMIFFTLQGLRTAAQEGANFGSHPILVMSGSTVSAVDFDDAKIVDRVRRAGGDNPAGFANLLDLNNDGVDDSMGVTGVIDNPRSASSFIYIQNLMYPYDQLYDSSGNPVTPSSCATTTPRVQMRNAGQYCYIRVTVSYNYRFIFPLAPAFGDTFRLTASYMIQVRSSFIG